jgi:ferrous iron transport protein B
VKKEGEFLLALVGQPNCGKSTVFNALTGAHQRVANWPGVTVDRMSGWFKTGGHRLEIVDLPGTYTLASLSLEERITGSFLIHETPSLVLNIVDASALGQGLVLTLQLREMGIPLVVNLNMMDIARKRGLEIDVAALERLLGVPVVATSMKKGHSKKALLRAISAQLDSPVKVEPLSLDYGRMEPFLRDMERRLSSGATADGAHPLRWTAAKLMEGDDGAEELIRKNRSDADHVIGSARDNRKAFEEQSKEAPEVHIARSRHGIANAMAASCITRPAPPVRPDRRGRLQPFCGTGHAYRGDVPALLPFNRPGL